MRAKFEKLRSGKAKTRFEKLKAKPMGRNAKSGKRKSGKKEKLHVDDLEANSGEDENIGHVVQEGKGNTGACVNEDALTRKKNFGEGGKSLKDAKKRTEDSNTGNIGCVSNDGTSRDKTKPALAGSPKAGKADNGLKQPLEDDLRHSACISKSMKNRNKKAKKEQLMKDKNTGMEKVDNRGRHLTSEKAKALVEKRWKKQLEHRNLPPLQCDNCAFSQTCPQYKSGFECAYIKFGFVLKSPNDVLQMMEELCEVELGRIQRGIIQENLSGGIMDANNSVMLTEAFKKLKLLHDMKVNRPLVKKKSGVFISILNRILGPGEEKKAVIEEKKIGEDAEYEILDEGKE